MTSEGSKFGNINSQPSCNRELQSMASALPGDEETPLVGDISGLEGRKSHHTRDVHILSLAFLLVFLAFGAAQNLQSTLNTEDDLGTTSLGILYLSFTFFSVVASLVVRVLGSKNALLIGTTGYVLYVAANLKPNWYTLVPASVYLGFCASIIWVGEGTYLTSAARSHSTDNNLHEIAVIGDFNGEFWAVYALHQFIGNLITFALLSDDQQEGSTKGTTLLFIVFLFIMTFGAILMCFLRKRSANSKGQQELSGADAGACASLKSLSKSLASALSDVKMLLIIPLIAYSGLQQAFVWAEFTKYVVTPAIGISGVGSSMAAYGAFDGICSLLAGRLTSGLTSITTIVSVGLFAQAVVLVLLLLNFSISSGFLGTVYILFLAGLLGIGDGVLMTQLNALIGILFKHDTEGAFAQLKIWQCATIAIVFFFAPLISFKAVLVIMLALLCFSFCIFLLLALKVGKAPSPSTSNCQPKTPAISPTILELPTMSFFWFSNLVRMHLSWPVLTYAATWIILLTLTVAVASMSPQVAFVSAITPSSSFSQKCSSAVIVAASACVVRAVGLWEHDQTSSNAN
ncbi:UNC93-like protein 3 [Glycine max]|nr:UNC93-like protein 3 [Glycine max]